jgi:hypothetical protein
MEMINTNTKDNREEDDQPNPPTLQQLRQQSELQQ